MCVNALMLMRGGTSNFKSIPNDRILKHFPWQIISRVFVKRLRNGSSRTKYFFVFLFVKDERTRPHF